MSGIFNMISRIPELQLCTAFVLVCTQLGIKHNAQMTELHPKLVQRTSLSLGGEMDQVSCMVFISLHIFSTGLY